MRRSLILVVLIAIVFSFILNAKSEDKDKSRTHDSLYFGEKTPGLIPQLFEPAVLSPDGLFEGGMFTPDMKTFYFTRKNGKYKRRAFFVIKYENNKWGVEQQTDIKWPEFSADGNFMYVGKKYRERTASGWSEPRSPGAFINNMAHGRSVSASGTYYFTTYQNADIGSIYFSRLNNGKYQEPVKLGNEINTGKYIAHPYIAPDESYLIWDARRTDGQGLADLYISFKQESGLWTPAINMGPKINTKYQESSPHVTYDGKYLFFTRGEWKVKEDGSSSYVGKRYWVDAKVIDDLREESRLLLLSSE